MEYNVYIAISFVLGFSVAIMDMLIEEIYEYFREKNKERRLQKKEGN